MRTNIFQHKNLTGEDHFTSSFVYVLNLFPRKIGDRLLLKLAVMFGLDVAKLGAFKEAKFIGHSFQNEESDSKPDLLIETSETKLFVEVKLGSPLSNRQLERHMADVNKAKGYLLFISNLITPISTEIITQKNYLKPKDRSHFIWAEIESIFRIKTRRDSSDERILNDFQKSLRTNGMRGRQIFGCTENLYTNGSDAENLILDKMQALVKDIGFRAWRKKSEFTLRINLKKAGVDPLLNPRFYSSGEHIINGCTEECMMVNCFTRHSDQQALKKVDRLADLPSDFYDVKVFATDTPTHYLLLLYIPLKFVQKGKFYDLDWIYMRKVWSRIYDYLK